MLNVKKYRAATTREALEMIKKDLGEDAFVLDTKRVKTGGFLGFRKTEQIEMSAAAAAVDSEKPAAKSKTVSRVHSNRILNLTDDEPAMPTISVRPASSRNKKMDDALSARAKSSMYAEGNDLLDLPVRQERKIEPVEISTNAPRIVHPKPAPVRTPPAEQKADAPSPVQAAIPAARELELLRAELREVKFSLGAFANRNSSQSWQSGVDIDLFSEVYDRPYADVYAEIMGTGVSPDLARKIVADIIPQFKSLGSGSAEALCVAALSKAIGSMVKFTPDPLKTEKGATLAIIGATGVGKTTTAAKLAAHVALYEHRRVELVTLDTYRIAAVEQLKTYAEIIGAGCHVVRSVFELDAVLHRIPADSTVLIDTTGRSPHDLADQYEVSDYLRQRPEIRKCLALQATTHPIDARVAIAKFEMYGADCLAITKMDETTRPGGVIETIADSKLPLAYICAGQRVPEDLQMANTAVLTSRILGRRL